MKRILIGTLAVMMVMPVMADDEPPVGDKKITSQPYVEAQLGLKQDEIPAANTAGVGAGDTVITYTDTVGGGVIGERELFTGGTYDADSDSGKLITAGALNNTFTNLPTTDTTKLQCANQDDGCTLWTIVDQTAYGVSGDGTTTIDLSALVGTNGTGYCYKKLRDGTVSTGNCTTTPSNYGDWGVMFTYNNEPVQVSGISACSSVSGTANQPASDQAQVQSVYESNMSAAPTSSPVGGNCYCKLTDPSTSAARWVFRYSGSVSYCASFCAYLCASHVQGDSDFRGAVFGVN